ncbi:S-adenosyl-L-methionine-dependent methyltransferase [Camillea tinctor]|nr:S-adenosyl-L-methionine-dependent methyltransferase [Camillea tinctor]
MTTPSPKTTAPLTTGEFGFSASEGADWSRYLTYRPIYPPSFYSRIFDYHAGKLDPRVGWDVAHDVGAGCGIVASTLASRFQTVVVSDPNEGYTELARRLLVEEAPSPKPEKRFRFVRERAEDARSVQDGSVDLVAACESIQWTDTRAAIAEFARQLRVGGTLVVTFYSRPKIAGDEGAARAVSKVLESFNYPFWPVPGRLRSQIFPS